jgi:ribosomal protein S18 acetylase RimI-like enzyme
MSEQFWIHHGLDEYRVRRANDADAPGLRALLNASYKELGDRGLNYTATYQDEAETLREIQNRIVYTAFDAGKMIATISMREENRMTGKKSAYVGKFGVHPDRKKRGLGKLLMQFIEERARKEGYQWIQLDTAKPAEHLVDWYKRQGYHIVGDTRFDGKTYESWIFEKAL